jgi:7-carboxy-7-deazaguanine synthase (Cx14CxxC type)
MDRKYKIKEIFYTIQGEGAQTGRPAVFVRFSGCNLWSGREEDRSSAVCTFCDTDFRGTDGMQGGTYTAVGMAETILHTWPLKSIHPFLVITGGEPLLQVDQELIDTLHNHNIEIAIETNGTIRVPNGIDWICVSPKSGSTVIQRSGDELKVVYPQHGQDFEDFASWDFKVFSLQPMDGPDQADNIRAAITFCMANPRWRLSLQTHKLLGLP